MFAFLGQLQPQLGCLTAGLGKAQHEGAFLGVAQGGLEGVLDDGLHALGDMVLQVEFLGHRLSS